MPLLNPVDMLINNSNSGTRRQRPLNVTPMPYHYGSDQPASLMPMPNRLSTPPIAAPMGVDSQTLVDAARSRLAQAQAAQMQAAQAAQLRRFTNKLNRQLANALAMHNVGPSMGGGVIQPPGKFTRPTGSLKQWIHQALVLSGHTGEHLAPGIANMIRHEDGSLNPRATNNWDSNAAAGTPSIGLMQTIQPTFDSYAIKGHRNIYDPVDNIIAGLRYALSRYGAGMVRAGGRHDAHGNYIGY